MALVVPEARDTPAAPAPEATEARDTPVAHGMAARDPRARGTAARDRRAPALPRGSRPPARPVNPAGLTR